MKICEKCRAAAPDGVCPHCGKQKTVKEAKPDDPVLLTESDFIWSHITEDALYEAGIPFLRHATLGSGVTVSIGDAAERFRYFVNASDYERALAVLPPPDIGEMSEEELERYMETYEEGEKTE